VPPCATACNRKGEKPVFRSGELAVDLVRRIVTVKGEEVKLTPREYDLLRLLVSHAGKVLTHKFILHQVWGGEADVQYLRIYIRTLRQKLEADPEQTRSDPDGAGRRLPAAAGGLVLLLFLSLAAVALAQADLLGEVAAFSGHSWAPPWDSRTAGSSARDISLGDSL